MSEIFSYRLDYFYDLPYQTNEGIVFKSLDSFLDQIFNDIAPGESRIRSIDLPATAAINHSFAYPTYLISPAR